MTLLPFVQSGDYYFYQGRKYKSLAAVEAAEEAFIAKAERAAGRRLSVRDLTLGVIHPEDRTRAEIIHANSFHVVNHVEQKADVHPFDRPIGPRGNDTRETLTAKMRSAYDARIRGEQPDPDAQRREDAIGHAHEILASVNYSPEAPMSIVVRAKQLITIARKGTLDEYKAASTELIHRIAEHKGTLATRAELQRTKALAELPKQFEAVEPLPEKPKPVMPYTWGDLKAEPDPAKRHRMWVEMEAAKSGEATDAS